MYQKFRFYISRVSDIHVYELPSKNAIKFIATKVQKLVRLVFEHD